ncbi:hypothetical protein LX32DRAFT_339255 [Colletotrichum zoysiae]|uniref:Uncharacterized protein n=1 Tax=Colletotrichum zoysiae TaxID=1216348 RepID=A0AAD9MA31_9PEZI|nr:hypothetical protein LX32DRAFT_339255 [Colletotrichum zoysiae]
MPVWFERPPKKRKVPLDDEIAPYPSTVRRAQRGLQEEDFEKEDIFRPPPSRSYLKSLVRNLKHLNQHKDKRNAATENSSGKRVAAKASTRRLSTVWYPTPKQFGRLNSEFRRRNDDKRAQRRRLTSVDGIISKHPVGNPDTTRPKVPPAGNIEDRPQHRSANSKSEKWIQMKRIPKRKFRFKVDERPAKKQR